MSEFQCIFYCLHRLSDRIDSVIWLSPNSVSNRIFLQFFTSFFFQPFFHVFPFLDGGTHRDKMYREGWGAYSSVLLECAYVVYVSRCLSIGRSTHGIACRQTPERTDGWRQKGGREERRGHSQSIPPTHSPRRIRSAVYMQNGDGYISQRGERGVVVGVIGGHTCDITDILGAQSMNTD